MRTTWSRPFVATKPIEDTYGFSQWRLLIWTIKKNALVNPIKRSNLDRVELKWVHAHGIICAHDLTLNIYPPGFEANPDDPKWHCMSWSCSANPKGQHWFLLLCSFGLSTALGFRRGVLGFLARFGLFALWLMGLACLALSVELLGIPGLSDGWT